MTGELPATFSLPAIPVQTGPVFKIFSVKEPGLTDGELSCCMSAILSSMGATFSSSADVVGTVCNLLCLATPGLAAELTKAQSVKFVLSPIEKNLMLQTLKVEDRAAGWALPDGFFTLPKTPTDTATTAAGFQNAYAGVSMVLYSIGKEFNSSNEAGAKENRPKALRDAHKIPDADFVSAPGKVDGPSVETLGQVFSAFSVYTEARAVIVRVYLSILKTQAHFGPKVGILMTSFILLDGAQMSHVSAIADMLEAHPWLVKVPGCRPSIREYLSELRRFAQLPAAVRGYVRLMESNRQPYFPSSKMMPLVAVAVDLKSDVEKTLINYMGGRGKYPELVAEVRRYKDHFAMEKGVDTLATLLQIPDVALPGVEPTPVITPQFSST